MNDFADDLLKGERSGKYTPIEVAQWLEDYAAAAADVAGARRRRATGKDRPEYRRLTIDIASRRTLAASSPRSSAPACCIASSSRPAIAPRSKQALKSYRAARDAWAAIVDRTKGVYVADITVGETRVLRGHWADRLADIDTDIAAVTAKPDRPSRRRPASGGRAIAAALARPPGRRSRRATRRRNFRLRSALAGIGAERTTRPSPALPAGEPGRALAERDDAGGRTALARRRARGVHVRPVPAGVNRGAEAPAAPGSTPRARTGAHGAAVGLHRAALIPRLADAFFELYDADGKMTP